MAKKDENATELHEAEVVLGVSLPAGLRCGGSSAQGKQSFDLPSPTIAARTREIGIRIALGAHPTRVARMFLASGVRLGVFALVLGLPLSVAGLRVAMSRGTMIAPTVNPYLIGVGIAVALLAVAAAATWVPARRAAMVDPATALRQE